jgi:hypothetical protein
MAIKPTPIAELIITSVRQGVEDFIVVSAITTRAWSWIAITLPVFCARQVGNPKLDGSTNPIVVRVLPNYDAGAVIDYLVNGFEEWCQAGHKPADQIGCVEGDERPCETCGAGMRFNGAFWVHTDIDPVTPSKER